MNGMKDTHTASNTIQDKDSDVDAMRVALVQPPV
jgi:hypothetical protein